MGPAALGVRALGIASGGWEPFAAPAMPPNDRHSLDLATWRWFRRSGSLRGASVPTLVWRSIRRRAVGTSIPGHDVSGTGRQTLGRAMQPITTIMPVWQCGHARNDRPVSASKRSR